MIVDFFKEECRESPRTDSMFGLCDDEDGLKAYSNVDDVSKWIATVKNSTNRSIVFTAIDKCVIKDNEHAGRGRCDGMLTSTEFIYFIELKNEKAKWISGAIEQLESTIIFFIENVNTFNTYKHKKAFACNKRHTHFQEIDNELNLAFYRKYKVRIDVQSEIIII